MCGILKLNDLRHIVWKTIGQPFKIYIDLKRVANIWWDFNNCIHLPPYIRSVWTNTGGDFSIWFISWRKLNYISPADQFNQFVVCCVVLCWQKTVSTAPISDGWAGSLLVFICLSVCLSNCLSVCYSLHSIWIWSNKLMRFGTFLSGCADFCYATLRTRLFWIYELKMTIDWTRKQNDSELERSVRCE